MNRLWVTDFLSQIKRMENYSDLEKNGLQISLEKLWFRPIKRPANVSFINYGRNGLFYHQLHVHQIIEHLFIQ